MSETTKTGRPDWFGGVVGVLVFLVGIALLYTTFRIALGTLTQPPTKAMGLEPGQAADLVKTGQSFVGLLEKVIVLLVMSVVGAIVASRGVRLYGASRGKD